MSGALWNSLKGLVKNHLMLLVLMLMILTASLLAVFLLVSLMGGNMKAGEEYDISRRRFQISFSSQQQMEEYMQDTALLEQRLDNSMELINGIQPLEAVELVTVQQETETGNKPPYRLEYIYAPLEVVTGRFFTREEFENREKKIVAGLTTNRSTLPSDQMQMLGDVYTVIALSSNYVNRLI